MNNNKGMNKDAIILRGKVRKYILKHFGKRCKRFSFGCSICMAWCYFDFLFMWFSEDEWETSHSKLCRKCKKGVKR